MPYEAPPSFPLQLSAPAEARASLSRNTCRTPSPRRACASPLSSSPVLPMPPSSPATPPSSSGHVTSGLRPARHPCTPPSHPSSPPSFCKSSLMRPLIFPRWLKPWLLPVIFRANSISVRHMRARARGCTCEIALVGTRAKATRSFPRSRVFRGIHRGRMWCCRPKCCRKSWRVRCHRAQQLLQTTIVLMM